MADERYYGVRAIEDNSAIDTEGEEKPSTALLEYRAWQKVEGYLTRNVMLQGRVVEVKPRGTKHEAIVKLEGFSVRIPQEQFITEDSFSKSFSKASPEEQRIRIYQAMRAFMGAKVCYVLKSAERDPETRKYTIMASRLEALERKRERFFSPDLPEDEQIKVGQIITCNILTVGEKGVRVEAYGVDTFMKNSELSLMHPVRDARDYFSPGDKLDAMVRKVYHNEDGSIYLRPSAKMLEHELIKDGYKDAVVGSTVTGYVMNLNTDKKLYTIVLQTGAYARVMQSYVYGGEVLAYGDAVSVEIKGKVEVNGSGEGYVTGSAMRLGGNVAVNRSVVIIP